MPTLAAAIVKDGAVPNFGGFMVMLAAVILLHPPLHLVGVSIVMERGCQQNGDAHNGDAPRCTNPLAPL